LLEGAREVSRALGHDSSVSVGGRGPGAVPRP
jgi:hypothetical protein